MSTAGGREIETVGGFGPLETQATHARTRTQPFDPRLHRRERGLQLEPESTEHHDARREGRVGEGKLAADEEVLAVQLVTQVVERAAQLVAGLLHTLPIALRFDLADLREQCRGRRDERIVAVVFEDACTRAPLRILGQQVRQRIFVF